MLVIRVEEENLEFIAELNGGFKPMVEDPIAIFVYHGNTKPSEVIPLDQAIERFFKDPTGIPGVIEYWTFKA